MTLLLRTTPSTPAPISARRLSLAVMVLTSVATLIRLELALFLLPLALTLVVQRKITVGQALAWGMSAGVGTLSKSTHLLISTYLYSSFSLASTLQQSTAPNSYRPTCCLPQPSLAPPMTLDLFLYTNALTVVSAPIDYLLWRPTLSHPSFPFTSPLQLLWPELTSLTYNIVSGQSANWGVSPLHYYFTSSLPKVGMASLPLAAFGGLLWVNHVAREKFGLGRGETENVRTTAAEKEDQGAEGSKRLRGRIGDGFGEIALTFGPGCAGLIGGMSLVGHKEWRFIIYAFPVLHILAALTAAKLWASRPARRLQVLIRLGLLGLIGLNTLATAGFTFASSQNYPGGHIWEVLERLPDANSSLSVHLSNLPLQTGSTSFTLLHTPDAPSGWPFPAFPSHREPVWSYSKSEDQALATPEGAAKQGMDYVVTDDWSVFEEAGWTVQADVGRRKLGLGLLNPRSSSRAGRERTLAVLKRPGS